MKNIEFYYDEIREKKYYSEMLEFAQEKGMEEWDITTKEQDLIAWLNEECKEVEILNEKEKEYLKAVIKPFRKNVKYIIKCTRDHTSFIKIAVGNDCIMLPYFNEEDMYLGMRPNERYTLEELGL